MGEKDLAGKRLEDYNDVFADIYNVLVFRERRLEENRLHSGQKSSVYKSDGDRLREQHRDTLKEYVDESRYVIASYGIENQSGHTKHMPVRVMGYDYGSYRAQMDHREKLHPVLTIVLNFTDRRWEENAKSIYGSMEIPEYMKGYVQDYRILVFDIAFLTDETIEQFGSDFKAVARFFKNKRLKQQAGDDMMELKHPEAVVELLSAFTQDKRYENAVPKIQRIREEGRRITMCEVLQGYIDQGVEQGIKQGIEQANLSVIHRMNEYGDSLEKIAIIVNMPKERVQEILGQKSFCEKN